MRNTKEDVNGITLIALVITIILLIILAGITLAQLQESGNIKKAKEAKEQTIEKTNEEIIQLAILELQMHKNGQAKLQDLNLFDDENSKCYQKDIKLKKQITEDEEVATLIINEREYYINKDFLIIDKNEYEENIAISYDIVQLPIEENDNEVIINLKVNSVKSLITKIVYPDGTFFNNLNGENQVIKENLKINLDTQYELECTLANNEVERKNIIVSVGQQLIPKMINDTMNNKSEVVAKITADSYWNEVHYPYYSFDKNCNSTWASRNNYPENLYYEFIDGIKREIYNVQIVSNGQAGHVDYDVQVFGSNDGENWTQITQRETLPYISGIRYNIFKSITQEKFNKFKFTCYGPTYPGNGSSNLWEIQMYGKM